jgi:hypothetical protein
MSMMISCVLGTQMTARADTLPVLPPSGYNSNRPNIPHVAVKYINYYSSASKSVDGLVQLYLMQLPVKLKSPIFTTDAITLSFLSLVQTVSHKVIKLCYHIYIGK